LAAGRSCLPRTPFRRPPLPNLGHVPGVALQWSRRARPRHPRAFGTALQSPTGRNAEAGNHVQSQTGAACDRYDDGTAVTQCVGPGRGGCHILRRSQERRQGERKDQARKHPRGERKSGEGSPCAAVRCGLHACSYWCQSVKTLGALRRAAGSSIGRSYSSLREHIGRRTINLHRNRLCLIGALHQKELRNSRRFTRLPPSNSQ